MAALNVASKCRALKTDLRDMKYSNYWNEAEVLSGDPVMYLRLMHFFVLEYSPEFRKWIVDQGYTLQTSTDMSFIEQTFRMLQRHHDYRPKITVANFFKPKFALQKLILCSDVARIVREKYRPPAAQNQQGNL
jgi:hypothetical protein